MSGSAEQLSTVIVVFAVLGPVVVAAIMYLVVILVREPSQPTNSQTNSRQKDEDLLRDEARFDGRTL